MNHVKALNLDDYIPIPELITALMEMKQAGIKKPNDSMIKIWVELKRAQNHD